MKHMQDIKKLENKDLKEEYHTQLEGIIKAGFDPALPPWRRLSDLTDDFLAVLSQKLGLTDLSIMAIGGYGRAELAPKSDIDIAILLKSSTGAAIDSAQKFVQSLWDSGLKASPIIGTEDELLHSLAGHHDRLTAFLDHRFIWGDQEAYNKFCNSFKKSL
ncbi:MAG: nucleotidyltransferase domain-containing protein, partial [Pseudomonadota bacterium]